MDRDLHIQSFESPFINTTCPSFEHLLNYGNQICYKKGEVIINIGNTVDKLHYMHKGKIKMSAITRDGFKKLSGIWTLQMFLGRHLFS